ncbi:hypothetical protein MIZ03_2010 [Rhodoferax lithotrophicus]|uniref:Uncharacterized protein n=1 Tax=Rhodoferax lithotrophicus TaxID=2798804 RepID=A0ABM7MLH4_9BURK|nr:hypothetical protein MIZ03_2010 [Rhodoferax sp. MIZ03]
MLPQHHFSVQQLRYSPARPKHDRDFNFFDLTWRYTHIVHFGNSRGGHTHGLPLHTLLTDNIA